MDGSSVAGWRRLRGGAVAALAAVLAAAGHTLGGGRLPDLALLAPAAAGLGWVSSGLARQRLRFPTVLGVLLAAQVGFHLLFLLQPAPSTAGSMPGVSMGGMAMPAASASSWLLMVGFHIFAAVVTAAVVACGEKALFVLAEPVRLVRLLAAPLRLPAAPTRWWTAMIAQDFPMGAAAPDRGPAPRRGPPSRLLSI